ncbi:MAG: 23S rRNA (uracil(1939)-C(5))-methyltransferase RlmD [Prevotellaceae bacterium]|jgi:23S rRNA (uracil1939-C5)-methyltransferase|nr:23S rRNA (uracil(1939)-C(5))-methyltransferase RlmD [Prevotellaceae bacterium]
MRPSSRPPHLLENVLITALAAEGKAIAHVDGKALFIPHAVPGDVVHVQITRQRRAYMEGRITTLVSPSPDRVPACCTHYGTCGGCSRQTVSYPLQLACKQQQVIDQLTRIGKLSLPPVQPIIGAEKTVGYRNKLEFTFSSNRWLTDEEIAHGDDTLDRRALGFHIPGRFDKVLDIDTCHLQADLSNAIRRTVKQWAMQNRCPFYDLRTHAGWLRNLIIRNTSTGEWMVVVVFAYDDDAPREALLQHLAATFPSITALLYVVNNKCHDAITDLPVHPFAGRDYLEEEMDGLRFRISPKSFYQTNSEQALHLYGVVRDMAQLTGAERVFDLYTGAGTIALFLARQAQQVTGIEYVADAVADAQRNALLNHIPNATFLAGDIKDLLNEALTNRHGRPDVVVLDPPRAGIHPDVAQALLRIAAPRLIYVSCNPASQARDLAILSARYAITRIRPVDMFPHTQHVENVVLCETQDAQGD